MQIKRTKLLLNNLLQMKTFVGRIQFHFFAIKRKFYQQQNAHLKKKQNFNYQIT